MMEGKKEELVEEADVYVPTPEKMTAPFAGRTHGRGAAFPRPVSFSSAPPSNKSGVTKVPKAGITQPVALEKALSTFKLSSRSFWPRAHVRVPVDGYADLRIDTEAVNVMRESGLFRVHAVTFNMHGKKKPPRDLRDLLPVGQYHVYAVATQECLRAISTSMLRPSKKQWEEQLDVHFGRSYVKVAGHSLGAIHLCVYVLKELLPLVGDIQSDAIATGLGKQLGNKGGVGVSFSLGQTSLAFISCHLAAHQAAVEQRNKDYHRIDHGLRLCPADMDVEAERVSDRFDRVFWLGDFNYRINGTRRMVDTLLAGNMHDVLQFNDQLRIERVGGRILAGFGEGPCNFRPTYKLDTGTLTYDTSKKKRIPSWTDRIFYRPMAAITLLQYDSLKTIMTSDHLPVFASFEVQLRGAARKRGEVGESASLPVSRPVSPIGFLPGTPRSPPRSSVDDASAAPVLDPAPAPGSGSGSGSGTGPGPSSTDDTENANPSAVEAKHPDEKTACATTGSDANPAGLPDLSTTNPVRAGSLPPLSAMSGPMSPGSPGVLAPLSNAKSPVLAAPLGGRSPLPALGAVGSPAVTTPMRSSPLVRSRLIPGSPDVAPDSEPIGTSATAASASKAPKLPAGMADEDGAGAADSADTSTAPSSPATSRAGDPDGGAAAGPELGDDEAGAAAASGPPKGRVASVVLHPHPVMPPKLRPRTKKPATVDLGTGTSQVCSIQ